MKILEWFLRQRRNRGRPKAVDARFVRKENRNITEKTEKKHL